MKHYNHYSDSWEDKKRRADFEKFLGIIGIIFIVITAFCSANFIKDLNKFHLQKEGINSILLLILINIFIYSSCVPSNNYEAFGWGLLITFIIFCIYWHVELSSKNEEYNTSIWQEKQYWCQFNGWEFEKEVAKLYRTGGFDAQVTKGSNDGGVDIILRDEYNRITIVQCKHHKNPVSVEPIRALWGCMQDFNADSATFIASSGFTNGCYEFVKDKPNYTLLTLDDLAHLAAALHGKLDYIYKKEPNENSNMFSMFITILLIIGTIILISIYTLDTSKFNNNNSNKITQEQPEVIDMSQNMSEAEIEQFNESYIINSNSSNIKKTNYSPSSDTNFDPYLKELSNRIKRNWHPPKEMTSNKVVVWFQIGRDGHLLAWEIKQFSGSTEVDTAAVDAIENSLPFKPIPSTYKGNCVEILFTFDYNVQAENSNNNSDTSTSVQPKSTYYSPPTVDTYEPTRYVPDPEPVKKPKTDLEKSSDYFYD